MASLTVRKGRERRREETGTGLTGCHSRHRTVFLITGCFIVITILITSVSLSTQRVAASSSSNSSGGYQCTFYVRSGIGYGVILSPTGNTSSSAGSDVRFTFTYNDSINNVGSRLSIYSYCDGLYVTKLNKSSALAVQYCGGNTAFYAVKSGQTDVCRLLVEESAVTPSGDEYRQILASTQDNAGWSSGYYVGQGATVVILTGSGGSGNSGQPATSWNLSPLGNVAVAVAVTISSLIPFFIVLPDAAKTLSDNIVTKRGRRSDGGDLYLSILSVFIPLLCMCVAVLSTTAMLNLLHQPIT